MKTRRQLLASLPAAGAFSLAARTSLVAASTPPRGRTIRGALSGRTIVVPELDSPPMPQISDSGMVSDDTEISSLPGLDPQRGHPDVLSHRLKLGLLIPATNTTMEAELWSILTRASQVEGLDGIGLHTANVVTPRPVLKTAADLEAYKTQFLSGLKEALKQGLLAQPHSLILGMSLEHILDDLTALKAPVADLEQQSGLFCATWHDAAVAALAAFKARRIGLLTPFDANGNRNARKIFTALGFEVVSTFGFACANALHIAHVPDEAKQAAITRHLATPANKLDAIVQCGTNMSITRVAEALEPTLGIPLIGINLALLWYALRELGYVSPVNGIGRLWREF